MTQLTYTSYSPNKRRGITPVVQNRANAYLGNTTPDTTIQFHSNCVNCER